jgi:hypothetical protein
VGAPVGLAVVGEVVGMNVSPSLVGLPEGRTVGDVVGESVGQNWQLFLHAVLTCRFTSQAGPSVKLTLLH